MDSLDCLAWVRQTTKVRRDCRASTNRASRRIWVKSTADQPHRVSPSRAMASGVYHGWAGPAEEGEASNPVVGER